MRSTLDAALARISPRIQHYDTPFPSIAIHCGVILLWGALFLNAFNAQGLFAWSVGIAYLLYDTVLTCFVAWKAGMILKSPKDVALAETTVHPPTLGIIVAAHNEAAVIPITMDALFAQTMTPQQIVIADDGSSDATAMLLTERYGLQKPALGQISACSEKYPNLYWLRLPHGGKARALNAALLALDTQLVMTVDADTLLEPDACSAVIDAFAHEPQLAVVAGLLTPVCNKNLSGRLFQWFQRYEYILNFISRYAWMKADSLLLVSGAFACFKRDAVMTVGGFDPQCIVEDYELIHRLRRYSAQQGLGWKVWVLGTARARTDAPSTIKSFLRQRRRWFAGFLQTQFWYRDMVGNRRYGKLGLLMLPVKAIDTVQPIYGLTALALLVHFLVAQRFAIIGSVAIVIGTKILIDLVFHLYALMLYRRWSDNYMRPRFGMALLATIIAPFSFQILRQGGAVLGWMYFLLGKNKWGKQKRTGISAI